MDKSAHCTLALTFRNPEQTLRRHDAGRLLCRLLAHRGGGEGRSLHRAYKKTMHDYYIKRNTVTGCVCVYYCRTYYKAVQCVSVCLLLQDLVQSCCMFITVLCVFITAVPITKLFARGRGSGGHVLRETTSRGLCELVVVYCCVCVY